MPLSARLAATASLMVNSTEAARNRGGSPTACIGKHSLAYDFVTLSSSQHSRYSIHNVLLHNEIVTLEEKMACGLLVPSMSVTFNSTGMSEQVGIL